MFPTASYDCAPLDTLLVIQPDTDKGAHKFMLVAEILSESSLYRF